jgi:hypothetical protein
MFNYQYEIKINKHGRPYIWPVNGMAEEKFVEHKFMGLELARTIVGQTIDSHELNPQKRPLPPEELERLKYLESELTRIANIFAVTIKEQFELLDIADRMINKTFDVSVDSDDERDSLNYNGFIFDDKIFHRVEGLKVKVTNTGKIYELKGGVDNEHWTEI